MDEIDIKIDKLRDFNLKVKLGKYCEQKDIIKDKIIMVSLFYLLV